MKLSNQLAMLAICFTYVKAVPVNWNKQKLEVQQLLSKEENLLGDDFFDKFQSIFGWGEETTTQKPISDSGTPVHKHTATTTNSYYNYIKSGHQGAPLQAGQPPLPPSPEWRAQGQATPAVGGQHQPQQPQPVGHNYPAQHPTSPYPNQPASLYPTQNSAGQYPAQPPAAQYPQRTPYPPYPYYPPTSYYFPYPYYPTTYYTPPQAPFYYSPTTPPLTTPHQKPHSTTRPVPRTQVNPFPATEQPREEEDQAEESHKVPNKQTAIPNRPFFQEGPVFKLPFPVTKSVLPINVLPPEDCHSASGLLGECLSASECGSTSGQPSGLCHMGRDQSLHARVCCTYLGHCGYETNHRVSYIRSPNFPKPVSMMSSCPYTINLLPGVCQIRLDFLDLKMKPMYHGVCDSANSMTMKSSHASTMLPISSLCGTISSGQDDPLRTDIPHVYAHFDMEPVIARDDGKIPNKDVSITNPSLQLHFNVTNYPSNWNIRVSQIDCDGANLQAPSGCSQYYNSNSGNISSFNLPDGEYMTDMNIDACIVRDPTACAIKYRIKSLGVGPTKNGGLGYGLVCSDFIKFRGEKTGICGKADGRELILPSKGPMGLAFRSDSDHIPKVIFEKIV